MKRCIVLLLTTVVLLCLAACNPAENSSAPDHIHSWKAATCVSPKTCSTCGATEGEAEGHAWKAATCTVPKTCTVCKTTEGAADGEHVWAAATCVAPKTCTACEKTEGQADGDHVWKAATCVNPKTCSVCEKTEGTADGAHTWTSATCDTPKTCTTCKKAEGAALGHKWTAANCTTAKTCSVCRKTEGSALGHKWNAANCTTAKTCSVCKVTEGYALGHKWSAATCTSAKTCSVCRKTEGYALGHKWSAANCTTAKTCSVCWKTEGYALGHKWNAATCTSAKTCSVCWKTEGYALGHSTVKDAAVAATCVSTGLTEGSHCSRCQTVIVAQKTVAKLSTHTYVSGYCKYCNASDPNYVPTFGVGEKWVVPGQFELTINSVTQHRLCDDGYDATGYGVTTAVMVNYTFKNLGSTKLDINEWDFEVYDANGVEGDTIYFTIYCDHGIDSKSCITGGTCTAKLPVALTNSGTSVTIYVDKGGKTGIFNIPITEPTPEDSAAEASYSRVKGEFTYKYNDFVGTRGDNGAKLLFIPKNTALKSQDNHQAMMFIGSKYDNGIVVEKCDGYGRFDTGEEVITAGEYIVIVASANTNRSKVATADELRPYLGAYLSDEDLETLALFIGFSKLVIDDLTVKEGYIHTLTHDFGITYF